MQPDARADLQHSFAAQIELKRGKVPQSRVIDVFRLLGQEHVKTIRCRRGGRRVAAPHAVQPMEQSVIQPDIIPGTAARRSGIVSLDHRGGDRRSVRRFARISRRAEALPWFSDRREYPAQSAERARLPLHVHDETAKNERVDTISKTGGGFSEASGIERTMRR
jgi:hypothetical protein